MEEEKIVGKGPTCKCPHHKVVPILVILIGLDFLAGAVGVLSWTFVDITWPILVIIGGIVKLGGCKCCNK
jgi:hypothetical protein